MRLPADGTGRSNKKGNMSRERHIGIFGRRNQGKSSLMNLLTGQQVSIVSETPGTTTDPVKKSCELAGLGKCVFVDTAGFDDEASGLGAQRVAKTKEIIRRLDMGILLISDNAFTEDDKVFAGYLQGEGIPFLLVHNKSDKTPLSAPFKAMLEKLYPTCSVIDFSVNEALRKAERDPEAVSRVCEPLFEGLQKLASAQDGTVLSESVLKGIVGIGDIVILVCPIDAEAPKGRLILPQVLLARQCLDIRAVPCLCQLQELPRILSALSCRPSLVITDSQVFGQVAEILPADTPLTSFSICLAAQKGNFGHYMDGTRVIPSLSDRSRVLILESCTHQVNCQDIGRFKLPSLLQKKTGKSLQFSFVSGLDPLPEDLQDFDLAIQCGGCMVGGRQLDARVKALLSAGLPVSNYGMALAWCNGIFERAVSVFRKS